MGLFALAMGILNSRRHFFAPSLAPVFLNICMILSVLLFFFHLKPPVLTLAFGVLAGGVLQFLFQIPFLSKKGITFRFNFDVRHPAIRRIGLLMVPGLIGTAVYQLNVFIDTIFASFLPGGSVSYLYFADRLMEFPLGIFAVAMGVAALPSLSELASRGRKEELSETVSFAFRLVSFISVPALVGLIALKTPIINLLFQRGVFDEHATQMTARALLCYCVGLWAIAGVRTVVPAFYALQDTKTPLKIGLICLGANVVLNAALDRSSPACWVSPCHQSFIFPEPRSSVEETERSPGKDRLQEGYQISNATLCLQRAHGVGGLSDLFFWRLDPGGPQPAQAFSSDDWNRCRSRRLPGVLLLDERMKRCCSC